MKHYLLDTNACIAWMKNNATFIQHLKQVKQEQVYICTPVRSELWFDACNSARVQENKQQLLQFFADIPCLPFDNKAADCCGEVRAYLKKLGTPIGAYDLQIASIAVAHDLTVVTNNIREFSQVPSLSFEDWQT